ncbi:MAG: MarR family transcriptional regulator [Lentilitoribacter sp.]
MEYKSPSAPKSIGRQLNFSAGVSTSVITQILRPYDLSLAQWAVLSCIWRNGALGIKDIAELTGNAPPAASRIVDRMVSNGLLLREEAKADRRGVVINLTAKGEDLRVLQFVFEQVNDVILKDFSQADQDKLFELLSRAEQNGCNWLKNSNES